jgi:hypothetical protein
MMKTGDRIAYPSRATVNDAYQGVRRIYGTDPPRAVGTFLTALDAYCTRHGLDFAILAAHSSNETDYWRDDRFRARRDGFGIGKTGPGVEGAAFDSYDDAAFFAVFEYRVKLGHAPILNDWSRAAGIYREKVDRLSRIVSRPDWPKVERIEDLNRRFGDDDCVWFCDPNGPAAIVAKGNAIFPGLPDQQGGPMPETRIPVIVLDAGHRSTDRSGNPAEMDLTDDLARAYRSELRRRGFTAFWYQEDLDRDADPDETVGDLNTVAKGLGRWLAGQPWALLLSLHYNAAHSPLHAIVPDNVGLSTAYPEGRVAGDTAANNVLDRRLGAALVQTMASRGLGGLYHGTLGEPGLMSERETGVGRDGFRLAVFAATAPAQQTAVRLVVEHGGTSDPAARRFADFARAAADALEAVYGQPGETPTATTTRPPATTTTTTTAGPPELPAGMSQGLAEKLYNPAGAGQAPPWSFVRGHPVSEAWLAHCLATAPRGRWDAYRWPSIVEAITRGDGRTVYRFSDGFVFEQSA